MMVTSMRKQYYKPVSQVKILTVRGTKPFWPGMTTLSCGRPEFASELSPSLIVLSSPEGDFPACPRGM